MAGRGHHTVLSTLYIYASAKSWKRWYAAERRSSRSTGRSPRQLKSKAQDVLSRHPSEAVLEFPVWDSRSPSTVGRSHDAVWERL